MNWFHIEQPCQLETPEERLALRIREEAVAVQEAEVNRDKAAVQERAEDLEKLSHQLEARAQTLSNPKKVDQAIQARLRSVEATELRQHEEQRRLSLWEKSLELRAIKNLPRDTRATTGAELVYKGERVVRAAVTNETRPALYVEPVDAMAGELSLEPPIVGAYLQMTGSERQAPHGKGGPSRTSSTSSDSPSTVLDRRHGLNSDPLHLNLVREVDELREEFLQLRSKLNSWPLHGKALT